jgi:hypothetical protein
MKDFQLPDPIPEYMEHKAFCFEVLHPKHVELDFQALMKSKDFLHRWSNSPWPEDHFTVEDNLFDLEWHYAEFMEKIAFTYTILDHFKTNCLGCIYIRPVTSIPSLSSEKNAKLDPFRFFISYWVITEIRNSFLEDQIFNTLNNWLLTEWKFQAVLFVSNSQIPEQNEIYRKNQMELFLELEEKKRYQQFWIPIKG